MNKTLLLPHYIKKGMHHAHKGMHPHVKVFGGDTETCDGEPFTLQVCGADRKPEVMWVNKHTILTSVLDYCDKQLSRGEWGAFYWHNLDFDLVALLYGCDLNKFKETEFVLRRGKWTINVFCGKRYFAKLSLQGHKTVYIIDSAAFLPFSLKKIAKELKLPIQKLTPPVDLGKKKFTPEDKAFYDYAAQDAELAYLVGEWIYGIHQTYDVQLSVSLPQLSGYIFKNQFLHKGDNIQLPPKGIIKAALLSYHGGKNGKYADAGQYKNCTEIDLNSAYAYAMAELPSFLEGSYREVDSYDPAYQGIYCISGEVACPYNIFFNHEFKPIKNKFEDTWVTSYELAEAMKHKEVKLKSIHGHLWLPDSIRNPFGDYVDYFYKLKQSTSKENSLYTFYKLAMNALYGKTIQAVELNNEETKKADYEMEFNEAGKMIVKRINKTYRAGGLFNPFIATLITGKVRAMIHDLEHRFKALHTATDSIKTILPVTGCSNVLGGYKQEVNGTCLMFRNKLYLHFAKDFSHCNHNPEDIKVWHDNQHLCKFALHGFTGKPEDLIELYRQRGTKYKVNHLFKVREALIQNQVPLKMVEGLTRQLNMNWNTFRDNTD